MKHLKKTLIILFLLSGCASQEEYASHHIKIKIASHQDSMRNMDHIAKNTDWNQLANQTISTYSDLKVQQQRDRNYARQQSANLQREINKPSSPKYKVAYTDNSKSYHIKTHNSNRIYKTKTSFSDSPNENTNIIHGNKLIVRDSKNTTTNNNYNSSLNNTTTQRHKTKDKVYQYEFIEGMAFIIRRETELSGIKYSGKGPCGSITSYDTEEEALSTVGCADYHGVGHSHKYREYSGKVYYCGKPLKPGFCPTDIEGDYGIGPGLTRGRIRWLCQDKALGSDWQKKCKEI